MASAFISYAHEDQEFVLALVEHLQGEGLDVRYDVVALHIGDSLITTISAEIAEGDFLIAIVSPDSVESEWCKKELSLAMTQGIDQKRVKVLPVRYQGAPMPPMLQDTFWGDAERDDPETLSRRLAAAMRAHLEGREAEASDEAERVKDAGGTPVHAARTGDATVADLDAVADKVWVVFRVWGAIWGAAGTNIQELYDEQRPLRWALDNLPERVKVGLPLVTQLAESSWDDFFAGKELSEAEPDVREELRSVRNQLAQGLPVTRRWAILDYHDTATHGGRDAVGHVWGIGRGDDYRPVIVYISGTVIASEGLPQEVAQAKATKGRSVVASLLALDAPPQEVMASTADVSLTMPG